MNYRFRIISLLLLASISYIVCSSKSSVKHNERYYQTKMCNNLNWQMEYVLKDRTRVDCLTDKYAIEVDFAKKWAESIGQSLYYAEITGKNLLLDLYLEKKRKGI